MKERAQSVYYGAPGEVLEIIHGVYRINHLKNGLHQVLCTISIHEQSYRERYRSGTC